MSGYTAEFIRSRKNQSHVDTIRSEIEIARTLKPGTLKKDVEQIKEYYADEQDAELKALAHIHALHNFDHDAVKELFPKLAPNVDKFQYPAAKNDGNSSTSESPPHYGNQRVQPKITVTINAA